MLNNNNTIHLVYSQDTTIELIKSVLKEKDIVPIHLYDVKDWSLFNGQNVIHIVSPTTYESDLFLEGLTHYPKHCIMVVDPDEGAARRRWKDLEDRVKLLGQNQSLWNEIYQRNAIISTLESNWRNVLQSKFDLPTGKTKQSFSSLTGSNSNRELMILKSMILKSMILVLLIVCFLILALEIFRIVLDFSALNIPNSCRNSTLTNANLQEPMAMMAN